MPELLTAIVSLGLAIGLFYVFGWLLWLQPAIAAFKREHYGWLAAMIFLGWLAGLFYRIEYGVKVKSSEVE